MKNIITKILLAAAVLCPAVFANVTVLESTPLRLVLMWEMNGFDTVSIVEDGRLKTLVNYDGGYVPTGGFGAPHLPGFAIHAGVPPRGAVRAAVEPLEFSSVRLRNPLRTHGFADDDNDLIFASRWMSEPSYLNMRNYRAARFVLKPVYGTNSGDGLRLLTKARIVIDFDSAPHTGAAWEPRDDFERATERLLANFKVAQGWQERRTARRTDSPMDEPMPFGRDRTAAKFRVGGPRRGGSEGTAKENGLIKISGRRIREIFGQNTPMSFVSVYASVKGEMEVSVPRAGQIPAGVFEIPILRYDHNGNGTVDDDDYIVICVSGASDWTAAMRRYSFAINRYDDHRTYWLTVGDRPGAVMEHAPLPPHSPDIPVYETFEDNVYIRTPAVLSDANYEGGADFAWKRMTLSRADTTLRLYLPGLNGSMPGSAQLHIGENSTALNTVAMSLGNRKLCDDCGETRIGIDPWGEARDLSLTFANSGFNTNASLELNGLHITYNRYMRLSENEGRLEIFSPEEAGTVRYRLAVSGGSAIVVSLPQNEREISLAGTAGGNDTYVEWVGNGGLGIRYIAALEKDITDYSDSLELETPLTYNGKYLVRDLRSRANRTDYLIITHEDFLEASVRLAEHKERIGFNSPKIVTIGDVYDVFGGGNVDPAAVRNFLLYVYRNWDGGDEFSYVLFNGAGHYDYKNVVSRNPVFIPVPYVNSQLNEEFYVLLDTLRHPGSQHYGYYFIGRLPSKTRAEALAMVDKIIEIEDPRVAEFDAWRNRILMTADDDQQGARKDLTTNHHQSTDRIARAVESLRPEIDIRKLYLYEHAWDENYFKPSATRALINEINNGISVVNWFGHGSMQQLADELLFSKNDVTALHNRKRYPLFTLFTCSAGKYDQPNDDSVAELLVRQPGAGASVVVSAAREVFAGQNDALAQPFYAALFDTAQTAEVSFGGALRIAKHRYNTAQNRYFVTLGDPSLSFSRRARRVDVSVTNANGDPVDTLKALQRITIKGTVRDESGANDYAFGGAGTFANVTLFNPPQDSATRKDGGTFTTVYYTLPGTPVFSAAIPVTNGGFEQQIMLPMNLSFGKPGVRVTAYVWNGAGTTGTGHIGNLIFHGSETGGLTDTAGPKISVRPVYNNSAMDQAGLFVRNRITSQLPLNMEISVEDESGINVIGTGPDEGLTYEVRGALSRRSANHLFRFSEGSFSHGTATLAFEENTLRAGSHEMTVSAQDLLGNVSKITVALEIVDPADLKLDHVTNVPNPVRMGRETRFYYYHSNAPGDLDANITIRVYSLGGRLLSVIRNPRNGEAWVPRDQKGNLLTPNVYLYQVTASSPGTGRTAKSKIKKLAVHPPR